MTPKPVGFSAWPKCYGNYKKLSDTCPGNCPEGIARQCKEVMDERKVNKMLNDAKSVIKNIVITSKITGKIFEPGKKPNDLDDLALELYNDGCRITCMDMLTIALGADGTWYLLDECNNIVAIDEEEYTVSMH